MNRLLVDEYRILSFDPGSYTLGMAVSSLNTNTMTLSVKHAETFKVDRQVNTSGWDFHLHGERTARLMAIHNYVIQCCETWSPSACVIELPYLGSQPQAFGSLKEVVLTLKNAVATWNPNRCAFFYEPSVIKKVVGVPGNKGDKSLMTTALKQCTGIDTTSITIDTLDEHSVDAILIGYAHLQLGIIKKGPINEKRKKRPSKKQ